MDAEASCRCPCEVWWVFFSLESGTVESHCSEGGISDVTAARHTKDLQLVASSAQTDQAIIRYLLEATRAITKTRHALVSLSPSPHPITACFLTVQDCILMVVSSGQCF